MTTARLYFPRVDFRVASTAKHRPQMRRSGVA